ncbi:potassium channel subfamily K member 18 [Puntigrus tetrazona]|uniref:potassium channel subfamily K member 18 n=1 Tax=Puntigrus tetrazona TaxID=1606681 RepID=UPI001C8A2FB4|nr:potassium channel subfamily K member 18 [Puntigrus tetrazona]
MELEEGRESFSKRKCARLFWRLFPHVFLIFSLILYAVFGALIFQRIEKKAFSKPELISVVAQKLVETVQNHTDDSTEEPLSSKIKNILTDFRDNKEYKKWSFYESLFFCCTLFTTVGYGQMYPVTFEGKVACILYAMVGIPLMLLVISDVGDILAVLLSKAYTRLNLFFKKCKLHRACIQRHARASSPKQVQCAETDGTYMFSRDVVTHEARNIQKVIKAQSSLRHTSLRKNEEIFNRMIIKENFKLKTSLTKSSSCPNLKRMPPTKASSKLFIGIGQEMEHFKVPLPVILLVVFAYMVICSQILRFWEKMESFNAFYFTFITLTTVGFGDIVPEHPNYFMVTFLFIITGMAIMSMAFKLGQSQIVSFYRRCIKSVSMGNVGKHKDLDGN